MARILQIMHAHATANGVRCSWSHYFDPSPEMLARLSDGVAEESWEVIEPEFKQ